MLELLLEGDQSYADLGELFGLDESEVKLRARTALAALGGADPDRKVPLSDYLLGKADPIDRADAVRHLKEDTDDHALAQRIQAGLAEIAPGASLVKLPESGGGRFMRKAPLKAPSIGAGPGSTAPVTGAGPSSRLTPKQTRLMAIMGGAALVLIVVVLGITGAFSSGDGGNTSSSGNSTTDLANGTDASGNDTATIALKAPGGGAAKGNAVIGVASGDQAYVDISFSGLDPAPKGNAYVVWMLLTRGNGKKEQGYPLAPIQTTKNGTYQNRFPVDAQILPVVARTQSVNISLAKITDIEKEIKTAASAGSPVIDRVGKTVLSGLVPRSQQTTAPAPGSTTTPGTGSTTTPSTTTPSTTTPSTTTPSTTTPGSTTGG